MEALPCPACGFSTMEQEYGSFEICSVCGWEDDPVQLANPCSEGGANRSSLVNHQAMALQKFPANIGIAKGFKRSDNWRPLTASEIKKFSKQSSVETWPNDAIQKEAQAYWRARS